VLWFGLLMVMQAPVQQQPLPANRAFGITIPRIEAEATIDGALDEPVWSNAARLTGFSQYEPIDGRPAEERTEVLVWYAPDAIHFGIIAHDREPATIRATRADRDNIDGEDHVIIYLDTFNDRRRAFFFAVNPLGVQQDGVRSEGASSAGQMFGGSNIDKNPDYAFDSRGRVHSEGYTVEVRVPFKSLRYAGSNAQTWGLNVVRKVQRTGYTDTWTNVRRASASFLAQAGTMDGLHDLRRGIVVEAQPFVTAKANGTRPLVSAPFERESLDPDAGANLRLGFTSLALDATVNPDFSQVESDAAQVTVNERFAIFFAEKRPFFLEGIDLFNTPNQLVYTRRIADPVTGGKVTGKLGSIGVAHITALDNGLDGARDALFNVTRLRRDFGSSSLLGVTWTDRSELDAAAYNRVLAADARWVFARLYYIEGQLGHSWTRTENVVNGATQSRTFAAPLWKLDFDRTGRSWGFHYGLNGVADDFVSAAGFVPRNGIVTGRAFNRFTLYGKRGALLETLQLFAGTSRIWRYDDFLERGGIEGNESANFMSRWRGGWQVNSEVQRAFVDLEPQAYANYETLTPFGMQPYLPVDDVSGPSISLTVTTPTFRLLDATARVQRNRIAIFAEGSEGMATSLTGGLSMRPNASLRINATNTLQRIVRRRDASEFARTIIPRVKAEYQPTRAFFFRAVAEYRSERRARLEDAHTGLPLTVNGQTQPATATRGVRVDLLASYEPTPGTVAFIGYGSSLNAPNAIADTGLVRMSDGFFLKLAYQFRR
jgi:hypothetical protein